MDRNRKNNTGDEADTNGTGNDPSSKSHESAESVRSDPEAARMQDELKKANEAAEACEEVAADQVKKGFIKEDDIAKLKAEMESMKDLMLRRQADFENYKKRQIKLQQEQQKLAVKDFALDIIHINDDLLRAVEVASNIQKEVPFEEAHDSFVKGVQMISQRIEDTLQNYGIVEIDSLNQPFDPMFNEAVEIEVSPNVESDTITKVYQKGFRIEDIVLRCARVRVAKPAPAKGQDCGNGDDTARDLQGDRDNGREMNDCAG